MLVYFVSLQTVFYFDIERKALREALDRFAQFFVSPVLNVTALDRELNLVHAGIIFIVFFC